MTHFGHVGTHSLSPIEFCTELTRSEFYLGIKNKIIIFGSFHLIPNEVIASILNNFSLLWY